MDDRPFVIPGDAEPGSVLVSAVSRTVTSSRQPSRHASGHVGVEAADVAAGER
jgi:hypothetical protein